MSSVVQEWLKSIDRCFETPRKQVLFGPPSKSLCPYNCDNGVHSIRLNAEMMQAGSSRAPYFGNRKGNSQPKYTSYEHGLETGGQVSNPALAVSKINNNDGVGAGKDSYTLYCGNGFSFPSASQWVSFENM